MSRIDRLALLLSLAAVIAAAAISLWVFEGLPHIEDEMAYTWQAKLIARGRLTLPTPEPCPNCFLVPFVVDHNGLRFGKYPLGWPTLLAAGELLDVRHLVNPLLAGITVWLMYLLVKRLTNERIALLGAFLTAASPFFLMNSGSLLAHPWSLLLTVAFCLAWLDAFTDCNPRLPVRIARSLPTVTAALALGVLALTRPLTAVGVAIPFVVHAIVILIRGDGATRKRLISFCILTAGVASLHFAWQFAVTGDPLLNPYTLWWHYDTLGFGPGVGLQEGGYQLQDAVDNAAFSLNVGSGDLFGWTGFSWLFLPFGLIALRQNRKGWLIIGLLPTLVITYGLYWIGSWLFGPRYYYEALPSPVLLTAAGIAWLAGRLPRRLPVKNTPFTWFHWEARPLIRFGLVAFVTSSLLVSNLFFYIPARMAGMKGLYNVSRACYQPFETAEARAKTPALVIVHVQEDWIEYGCMVDMSSPFMDSDFVVTISRGEQLDNAVAKALPNRRVLHYYPDIQSLQETQRQFNPR